MTHLFQVVLGTGVSLTPAIILLMAVSAGLGKRYCAQLRHLLWGVVAVRLALPFSLPIGNRITIPTGEPVFYLEQDTAAVLRAFAQVQQGTQERVHSASSGGQASLSWLALLACIWIVVAVLLLGGNLWITLRKYHKLWRWSVPLEQEVLQRYEEIRGEMGVHREIPLITSWAVETPMMIGVVRPAIFLPAGQERLLVPVRLESVLRHELQHYKRRDLWFKVLVLLVSCVYWWNPVVHIMTAQAEADMELACDSQVLYGKDSAFRKKYGRVILNCAQPNRDRPLISAGFWPEKKQLARRIRAVLDTGEKRKGLEVFSLLTALILLSSALIGCGGAVPSDVLHFEQDTMPVEHHLAKTGEDLEEEPLDDDIGEQARPLSAGELEQMFLENSGAMGALVSQMEAEVQDVYGQLKQSGEPFEAGVMQWPVPNYYMIASTYGWRFHGSDFHTGIDITGGDIYGKPVVAAKKGTVLLANRTYTPGMGYGQYIIVDHGGGITTLYAQLSEIKVSQGDVVESGQQIGSVGSTGWSTGPHFHFEVREDGQHTDPMWYLTE